ncbi:MAG TPA: TlpA disulfide reductase family protein [Steroidobacteraceae bacterium]
MRKAFFAGSLILGAAMAALSFAAAPTIVGKPAPDFALRGLDGRNLRLSEFRGQVVLVNFWARSDGNSRQQMPALDRINITYQRAGLVVLGVSVDDDLRRAKEFATSMGVSYPILFDTGAGIGKDYFLQKTPMTILVDRGGVVRYSAVGFKRGDERVYLDQIRELLRE